MDILPWNLQDLPHHYQHVGIMTTGRHSVSIWSNVEQIHSWFENPQLWSEIPEYDYRRGIAVTRGNIIYEPSPSYELVWLADCQTFIVRGTIEFVSEGRTIHYVAYQLLELIRQQDCEATLHAAAVSGKTGGVLLIGQQGAGKTSIVLELCRAYGFKLISTELSFIGYAKSGGTILGGSKWFSLRHTSVMRNQPDLLNRLPAPYQTSDPWNTKYLMHPAELDVRSEYQMAPLTQAYYIRLTGIDDPLFVQPYNRLVPRIFLYEQLSRYIRGTCIPALGGSDLIFPHMPPMLDSAAFHEWRVAWIEWLLTNDRLKYISGNLHAVCEYIRNDMNDLSASHQIKEITDAARTI